MTTMQKTAGISGIAGYTKSKPFASPAQMQGDFANPAHQQFGESVDPYPWNAYGGAQGPYVPPGSPEDGIIGDDNSIAGLSAGSVFQDPEGDFTPYYGSHAAPFPKGVMRGDDSTTTPAGSAAYLQQSAEIHGSNTNAGASRNFSESLLAHNDQWVGFYNPIQGEDQVESANRQIGFQSGGFGVNDHTSNSMAKINGYELNTAHRHRRYATGSIPGNSLWLRAKGRPMIKTMPHGAILPVGANSPFAGQDVMDTYGIDGAILQQAPTAYVPPPQAYVNPATQAPSDVPNWEEFV